jgi:hypothetical protein
MTLILAIQLGRIAWEAHFRINQSCGWQYYRIRSLAGNTQRIRTVEALANGQLVGNRPGPSASRETCALRTVAWLGDDMAGINPVIVVCMSFEDTINSV